MTEQQADDFNFEPERAAAQVLFLIESVVKRFEQNDAAVSRYDSERGDLDHVIELTAFSASQGYDLVKRIRDNRRARRICKDENLVMKPLYDFIQKNGQIIRDLKRISRETERQAAYLENRQYHPRTGIISAEELRQKRIGGNSSDCKGATRRR